MTNARQPLGQDLMCIICHSPGPLDIDHVQNRGMGGSKARDVAENKVALCRACHALKTLNRIKAWLRGDIFCWKKMGSDVILRTQTAISGRYHIRIATGADDSTALPETDTELSAPVDGEGVASDSQRPVASRPSPFSLEDWCQEGMNLFYWGLKLKSATDDWRWRVGDWLVHGEEVCGGESVYQYFEPLKEAFGYDALRQYRSVAERCDPGHRVPELSWSHHRAVASLDEKAMRAALLTAKEEGLTKREVAAMVRPEPAERERCTCPTCGHSHLAVVESEWKA